MQFKHSYTFIIPTNSVRYHYTPLYSTGKAFVATTTGKSVTSSQSQQHVWRQADFCSRPRQLSAIFVLPEHSEAAWISRLWNPCSDHTEHWLEATSHFQWTRHQCRPRTTGGALQFWKGDHHRRSLLRRYSCMRSRPKLWHRGETQAKQIRRRHSVDIGSSLVAARRRESSHYHWKIQTGDHMGKIRGASLHFQNSQLQSRSCDLHDRTFAWQGGLLFADDPAYAFHNDTSAEVAAYWSSYTTHSDLAALATPLKYAGWRHVPTVYLLCELDRCMPPYVQEGMVAATEDVVKTVRLPSGHLPMLSMPEKFIDVLLEQAGEWITSDHWGLSTRILHKSTRQPSWVRQVCQICYLC